MRSANRWPLLLVALLIVTLGVLATQQSRWITEVNQAQEQRLRAEVEGAARRFSEEIDREFVGARTALHGLGRDVTQPAPDSSHLRCRERLAARARSS